MVSKLKVLGVGPLLVVALCVAGCGDDSTSDGPAGNNGGVTDNNGGQNNGGVDNNADTSDLTTYHRDLRPLIDHHCMNCHAGEGPAPESLDFSDPKTVSDLEPIIMASVESGRMPPWQLTDDCADIQGSLKMTPDEIATFQKWGEDGKVMGDEADYVARTPRNPDIGSERLADDEVLMAVPEAAYEPKASVADDFRCFVIDPGFEEDRYMTGFETIVDNKTILHHIVAFQVPASADAQLAEFEAEDEAPGYECFGSARADGQSVIAAWAPGGGITGLPENTAIRFRPGTKIVLQMHYNLAEGGAGNDQSSMKYWFMPKGERPQIEGQMVFVGNLPFQVPAGVNGVAASSEECETVYTLTEDDLSPPQGGVAASDPEYAGKSGCVTQELYYRTPRPARLYGTFPHMHLKGKDIKIEVMEIEENGFISTPMEDTSECLVETHNWDFNWQRAYWYDEVKTLPQDGVVRLTCKYDNSTGSDDVQLGDGSGDEMCLGLLYLAY